MKHDSNGNMRMNCTLDKTKDKRPSGIVNTPKPIKQELSSPSWLPPFYRPFVWKGYLAPTIDFSNSIGDGSFTRGIIIRVANAIHVITVE